MIEKYFTMRTVVDREEALRLLREDGLYLQNVSPSLQDDKEVVMAAILQNGLALEFASNRLKEDLDIAEKALENDYMAYLYIGRTLKEKSLDFINYPVEANRLHIARNHNSDN